MDEVPKDWLPPYEGEGACSSLFKPDAARRANSKSALQTKRQGMQQVVSSRRSGYGHIYSSHRPQNIAGQAEAWAPRLSQVLHQKCQCPTSSAACSLILSQSAMTDLKGQARAHRKSEGLPSCAGMPPALLPGRGPPAGLALQRAWRVYLPTHSPVGLFSSFISIPIMLWHVPTWPCWSGCTHAVTILIPNPEVGKSLQDDLGTKSDKLCTVRSASVLP